MCAAGHQEASSAWPDVQIWTQRVFRARNANEARLFVQCQGGVEVEGRAVGTQFHIRASHPEGERVHRFTLARGAPWDPTDFGEGVSDILDPAELLFFADAVILGLPGPDDRAIPRAVVRRLRLAAAALREAAKLMGRGDVVYYTNAAGLYAASHADRFTVDALTAYAAEIDEVTAWWERQ